MKKNSNNVIIMIVAGVIAIAVIIAIVVIANIKNNKKSIIANENNNTNMTTTGSFNTIDFFTKNYRITGKSKISGHPSGEYDFSTYFIKEFKEDNYEFLFNVNIGIKFVEKNIESTFKDYASLPKITVDGKEMQYKKVDDKKATLLYKNDEKSYLQIDLIDESRTHDNNGKEIENVRQYDLYNELANSDEFATTISFDIKMNK